tara:strand:+ start:87 stop:461 length:375 start_codon:yes stop_codon:yes gene_type:complete
MYLFVYGTLIKGESNHKTLGNSKLIGDAFTKGRLFDIGDYPALIPEGDNDIKGEIYEVNHKTLIQCDLLEGYEVENPNSLYIRKIIAVKINNKVIRSYIYYSNFDLSQYPEIASGDYVKNRKKK